MKGHGSNTRYRLKTKSVHGVRTGQHNNPHVLKAGLMHRADGGVCPGESAPKNLGRMGRRKGGKVVRQKRDIGGAANALTSLSKLGTPQQGQGQQAPPAGDEKLDSMQKAGQGLMSSALGLRKHGGKVMMRKRRDDGGPVSERPPAPSTPRPVSDAPEATKRVQEGMPERKGGGKIEKADGGATPSRPPAPAADKPDTDTPERKHGGKVAKKKEDGGEVAEELAKELDEHKLEHALMATEKKKG